MHSWLLGGDKDKVLWSSHSTQSYIGLSRSKETFSYHHRILVEGLQMGTTPITKDAKFWKAAATFVRDKAQRLQVITGKFACPNIVNVTKIHHPP